MMGLISVAVRRLHEAVAAALRAARDPFFERMDVMLVENGVEKES